MSDITTILASDAVASNLASANKKTLFHQLSQLAARATGLDVHQIATALVEREKLGSTGFGAGVAIPHGKVEGLDHVTGFLARLSQPIDFDAVDGLPVDIVFVLLSPPDAGADHLKALAGVSRMLRDRDLVAKLRGARSNDAIYALIAGVEALDAA